MIYLCCERQNGASNTGNTQSKSTAEGNNQSDASQKVYTEAALAGMKVSASLTENIEILSKIVGGNADLVIRNFTIVLN